MQDDRYRCGGASVKALAWTVVLAPRRPDERQKLYCRERARIATGFA